MMQPSWTRRAAIAGAAAFATPAPAGAAENPFAALERIRGGRLGVFAVDSGSGRRIGFRADERFVMCSTFKALLAAAVLARVDAGAERLERPVNYARADLLDHAPVTSAHLAEGRLPVGTLCQAAVEVSDNTAANLLLASLGGPAAVTRFCRRLGDGVTRLDRTEPALNTPNGLLDTTTPRAMAGSFQTMLLGSVLKPRSRVLLERWLAAAAPGLKRIRAGVPAGWMAGDKSGTGRRHTNDVAILRPPGRAPILVAAYYEAPPKSDGPMREAVLRDVGAAVAAWAG